MTGGLMQLVGKGAQDQLVVGNPSFTNFRSVYKRHTDFAMEHFRLVFKTTQLSLPPTGSLKLQTKVERYAQLLYDCYLTVTLPDIWSPVSPVTPDLNPYVPAGATAVGYDFQWIRNIGYNMINYVAIVVNGSEIVRHTGEWMKLYATTKFDKNKKQMLNQMMGNIPELYDPANAYDRINQYPNAISSATTLAAPSIPGRTLRIPLHFWFCENVGAALPLIAMQYSEVDIVVELKNIYQLFTIVDVRDGSPTCGLRVAPEASVSAFTINHFLSPPLYSDPTTNQIPTLRTWDLDPFIEANYIFVTDAEMAHIAKTEHSFIINQVDPVSTFGQHGPANDLELTMRNLCTRVLWVAQRSDRPNYNDYDNYTNWEDPYKPPLDSTALAFMTPWYSSGVLASPGIAPRDILLESSIILDGKERFHYKSTDFFSNLQNYKHHTGESTTTLPGLYTYSFALEHHSTQPSGHINGSMFNKTILRNSYVQPPLTAAPANPVPICVLKSTANNPNPTVIVNPNALNPATGMPLYNPEEVVTIIRKSDAQTLQYTYNVRAYVETYNFFRVLGGVANVVFSS